MTKYLIKNVFGLLIALGISMGSATAQDSSFRIKVPKKPEKLNVGSASSDSGACRTSLTGTEIKPDASYSAPADNYVEFNNTPGCICGVAAQSFASLDQKADILVAQLATIIVAWDQAEADGIAVNDWSNLSPYVSRPNSCWNVGEVVPQGAWNPTLGQMEYTIVRGIYFSAPTSGVVNLTPEGYYSLRHFGLGDGRLSRPLVDRGTDVGIGTYSWYYNVLDGSKSSTPSGAWESIYLER